VSDTWSASPIRHEDIDHYADDQRNWAALIPAIKRTKYLVQSTSDLSIHGDAPKCFLLVKEYQQGRPMGSPHRWPRYIAKVGSKKYPIESITEQLITRLGQCLGFPVADSKLCMVGRQVRFLSRYFLREDQALTHGIELFRDDFGTELVDAIAARKSEREFYTFPGPSGICVGSSIGENAAFPWRQGACSTRSSISRFSA
jgi:hypothetical protein